MSGLIPTRVLRRIDWTDGLATFVLDEALPFEAGQFFNLGLAAGDKIVRRSYSAASAPNEKLEFFVSHVRAGELTPGLFDCQAGDEVLLDRTPLGFFTLKEVPDTKRLWLVATGTGLGPYLSMLRAGALGSHFERVVIVHGVRHATQTAYSDELRKAASASNITYLPVLSGREHARPEHVGRENEGRALSGRITSAWDDGSLEEAAGPFDEECHMLLCGNPQMIGDMVERLKARGFEKHRRRKAGHFNFEKYW